MLSGMRLKIMCLNVTGLLRMGIRLNRHVCSKCWETANDMSKLNVQ